MGAGGDARDHAVGAVEIAIDQLAIAAGLGGQGLDIEAGEAVAQQDALAGLDDEGLGGGAAAQTDGRFGHPRSIGPRDVSRQAGPVVVGGRCDPACIGGASAGPGRDRLCRARIAARSAR